MRTNIVLRNISQVFTLAALLLMGLGTQAWAHNQSPATIKRAMEKSFKILDAEMPKNFFKGQKQIRAAGTEVQIFVAKKEKETVGVVAQLEVAEKTNVIAYSDKGEVLAVLVDGGSIEETSWATLPYVKEIRSKLFKSEEKE